MGVWYLCDRCDKPVAPWMSKPTPFGVEHHYCAREARPPRK